jgi:serine/threonine protein kinase/tetratricopeptide (TPR) repeat protein
MNICGLTDSFISVEGVTNECPSCHGTPRVANGLCLSCLLNAGLGPEIDNTAEFSATLEAIAVPDSHWQLGNYEILEEIGRGGMGVIYRARQRHSRRIVAVKRLLGYHADSLETLVRFRREAEAAASLDHPNILPIYEVSESEDQTPFFSMKFAAGGSLEQAAPSLQDNFREIVRLMARVTRAVQFAHRQGILHRDLKPGNILLDGRGEPLVSDFGLAKWLDTQTNLTRTLTIFGTPGFIAPEQAHGPAAALKPTADIYSLGAILFDLLAGRPPFLGEHAIAVIQQASEKTAPKLRSLVKTADRDLETICLRCLEREPTARYPSAADLAEDLERWLEGRPILARPVSAPVRVWRWGKRNPLVAGSLAATLIIGCLAIGRQIETRKLAQTIHEDKLATHSIAILPFLDLDTVQTDNNFAQSFASTLASNLATLGTARVIADTNGPASFPGAGTGEDLREVGIQSGVRTAITGTLRLVSRKWRISLRLSDVNSGQVLLARVLELDAGANLTNDLARQLAKEMFSVLSGGGAVASSDDPAVTNSGAHEFLRAGDELLSHQTTADFDRALECYRRAIELAPKSAVARAAFVVAAVNKAALGSQNRELLEKAEQYGREAVALNGNLESTHRALESLFYLQGDFVEAREEALKELETGGFLFGAVGLSLIDRTCGRPDLAVRWSEICGHWSSRPADCESICADSWATLGDDEKAQTYYRRVSDLYPETPEGWIGLCRLKLLQGDLPAARKIYQDNIGRYPNHRFAREMAAQVEFFSRNFADAKQRYIDLDKENPNGGDSFYDSVTYQSALGRSMQEMDDDAAREILQRSLADGKAAAEQAPNHPRILYRLAAIEASLGEVESSLTYLNRAFTNGWLDYRSLALDPRFDRVRGEVRYHKIFEAMAARVASLRRSQSTDSR